MLSMHCPVYRCRQHCVLRLRKNTVVAVGYGLRFLPPSVYEIRRNK